MFAWFAFVPLLLLWEQRVEARAAFLDAYVVLLVTFAIVFQWPLFHALPATALLSLPPLLVLPMWMAAPFGVAHLVYRRLGVGAGLAAWVAFTLLAEYGLCVGPLAFPWTLIGHSQAEFFPVNGLAAFGGVPLLSLVVLLANAASFLVLRRASSWRTSVAAVCAAILLAGTSLVMVDDQEPAAREAPGAATPGQALRVRVAGIQPALSPAVWADLGDSSRVTMILDWSRQALAADSTVDIIVWPETAIPPNPSTQTYIRRVRAFVDSTGVPVLAGAITSASGQAAYRNSAIFLTPRSPVRVYDKINLVPFAERVPFSGTLPFLERLAVPAGGVSGYVPGEYRTVFEITDLRFGVLICFETLFADPARRYKNEGADVLIAITQDGWWGNSFGYQQHLAFNRLRAIETGLPMIQASVTGLSALIYPDGRIDRIAGWMERSIWTVDVPPKASPTLYGRVGDWVTLSAAVGGFLLAVLAILGPSTMQTFKRRRDAT